MENIFIECPQFHQYIKCPWCFITHEIQSINCGIFRCGQPTNPHASKEWLAENKSKQGCNKPFRIQQVQTTCEQCCNIYQGMKCVQCEYI